MESIPRNPDKTTEDVYFIIVLSKFILIYPFLLSAYLSISSNTWLEMLVIIGIWFTIKLYVNTFEINLLRCFQVVPSIERRPFGRMLKKICAKFFYLGIIRTLSGFIISKITSMFNVPILTLFNRLLVLLVP